MNSPNRRWFRFSLRTLFVVVTAAAIMVAGALPLARRYAEWKRIHQYDELVRLIETTVTYNSSGP
jgi:hypothetical protein